MKKPTTLILLAVLLIALLRILPSWHGDSAGRDALPVPVGGVSRPLESPLLAAPSPGGAAAARDTGETTRPVRRVVASVVRKASAKHPLVRVEEEYSGPDSPPRRVEMAADQLLLPLADGDLGKLRRFVRNNPGAAIDRVLSTGRHALVRIPHAENPDSLPQWRGKLVSAGFPAAQPNYIYQFSATPNDPSFSQLWGQHNTGQSSGTADADMDAPEAWNIGTGSADIIVAVIDSGVDYNHPDLAANMWTAGGGGHGYDFFDNDADPIDLAFGHGTHVAGIIGAVGNNATGVTGVCWNTRIMALRVGDSNGADMAAMVASVNYAVTNGARVINMSIGGAGGFPGDALNQMIIQARNQGVLVVVAAGNDGANIDTTASYPACYPEDNIITVASSDRNDARASTSNFGSVNVDLAAPGVDIYSTLPNNSYANHSGTSMATPQVAGAAALILSVDPTLTYQQVRSRILSNVDAKPAFAANTASGGRLNVFRAIQDYAGPRLALSRKLATVTTGNGDAWPNPGETVRVDLTLANNGNATAANSTVTASLAAGAPAALNRTVVNFGSLASHASVAMDGAFTLTLQPAVTLPAAIPITFTLATPSATTTWTDTLTVTSWQAASLVGRVVRAGTGAPVSGATVTVTGPVPASLTTAADGTWSHPCTGGSYQVGASAPGLVASVPQTVAASGTVTVSNILLGNSAPVHEPDTLNLVVPPNQTVNLQSLIRQTGDTPRAIPFTTSITGSGLGTQKLYAIQSNSTTILELNPTTGAQTASHPLSGITSSEIYGTCVHQGTFWILKSLKVGADWIAHLIPVNMATWTLGTPVVVNDDLLCIASGGGSMLATTYNLDSEPVLHTVNLTTGALTTVGTLTYDEYSAFTYSVSRNRVFFNAYGTDVECREFTYPGLAPYHSWTIPDGDFFSLAYGDLNGSLYLVFEPSALAQPIALQRRNPDTGAVISGFSAPANIEFVATGSAGGVNWLSTTLSSSDIPAGGNRAIPLTVNTSGMTAGQAFTATLVVSSSLTNTTHPLTVNLTVGTPPSGENEWAGWFHNRHQRLPANSDVAADADLDGVPTYLEFATGGEPSSPLGYPGKPVVRRETAPDRLELVYHLRKTLPTGSVLPQASTSLSGWQTVLHGVGGATVTTVSQNADFNRVTVTVPVSAGRKFLRLGGAPPAN